jgi:hypothetical protein
MRHAPSSRGGPHGLVSYDALCPSTSPMGDERPTTYDLSNSSCSSGSRDVHRTSRPHRAHTVCSIQCAHLRGSFVHLNGCTNGGSQLDLVTCVAL